MKIVSKFLAVTALLAFSFAPILVRAQDDAPPPPDAQDDQSDQGASFQTFYDQLGDQGTWVQTDDYGYVFQPAVTDPQWAPYTDGHWVYTDAGWTWASDEPWGWATYHYGRWANMDGYGWVWVPGYRWAPAWVSWRYGGGYAGWAPLPPETFVGAEYGGSRGWASFHFGSDVDVSFGIGAGFYNFVNVGDMGERNYRGHYLDRSRNYAVINNTTNITNINITNNYGTGPGAGFRGVTANGPQLSEVNAHSRQQVATVRLTASSQPGRSNQQGGTLAVFAPRMNPASVRQARPANVARTISHPTFNRGTSITKPLAVTASVRPPAPSPEAIQAARAAQLNAPATAKIATAKTPFKTTLSKPLTSMAPVAPVRHTTSAAAPASNPNVSHPSASSPFTGESEKPAVTQPNPVKPETTFHPEPAVKPAPSAENSPAQAQQEARQQQQAQSAQEARLKQQQQAQAQEERQKQAQAQAQAEARQQQQAQAQQELRPQQQPRPEPQVEAPPQPRPQPQPQAQLQPRPQPQAQPAPASHPAAAPANKPAANGLNKPLGQ